MGNRLHWGRFLLFLDDLERVPDLTFFSRNFRLFHVCSLNNFVPIFLRMRPMSSFFFLIDGIVLENQCEIKKMVYCDIRNF